MPYKYLPYTFLNIIQVSNPPLKLIVKFPLRDFVILYYTILLLLYIITRIPMYTIKSIPIIVYLFLLLLS